MKGVTIALFDNGRRVSSVDLKDIIRLAVSDPRSLSWQIANVEAVGSKAHLLHRYSETGQRVSGEQFLGAISGVDQTIEGTFDACKPDSINSYLRIRAVDGAAFDVESDDTEVLETIRRGFSGVSDMPND